MPDDCAGVPLAEGDRVEAVWFSLDDGLRIWPVMDNGRPTGRWRLVQVTGADADAVITELARADSGHELEAEHPDAKWGINDNETVPPGTQGTVREVSGASMVGMGFRQFAVSWDNGSTIGLTEKDLFRKV